MNSRIEPILDEAEQLVKIAEKSIEDESVKKNIDELNRKLDNILSSLNLPAYFKRLS